MARQNVHGVKGFSRRKKFAATQTVKLYETFVLRQKFYPVKNPPTPVNSVGIVLHTDEHLK
jgi:hypothetical protein